MEFAADILLIAGAFGVTLYCVVLSRRLKKLADMEHGIGGAITALSKQVDALTGTLDAATDAARASAGTADDTTRRAEAAARRLELLIAALHDLPQDGGKNDDPLFYRKEKMAVK